MFKLVARATVVAALAVAGLAVASPAQAYIISCSKSALSPEGARAFCYGTPPNHYYVSLKCLRQGSTQTRFVNGPVRLAGSGQNSDAYCGSGWARLSYTYFTTSS